MRIRWDTKELERIETIKAKTGIKNQTDVVRSALMEKYVKVTGSPSPELK